jgi:integrase
MGLLTGKFSNKGLRYPKFAEKPPFQTWAEIERRIKAGGLTKKETAELWDSLYLTLPEIEQILNHVKAKSVQPWVYPLFCFAAYTGARRAEMLRVLVSDVDFESQTVLIREKKRARGKTTTRGVALSPFLAGVLKEWLGVHPGGQNLFSQRTVVVRSQAGCKFFWASCSSRRAAIACTASHKRRSCSANVAGFWRCGSRWRLRWYSCRSCRTSAFN